MSHCSDRYTGMSSLSKPLSIVTFEYRGECALYSPFIRHPLKTMLPMFALPVPLCLQQSPVLINENRRRSMVINHHPTPGPRF